MKNYYAILEVPVGCGVADIRAAYRRLSQDTLDDDAAFADLKEAHEVLTTPARRADYDRAVWGETFAEPGAEAAPLGAAPLPGSASLPDAPAGPGRCPMGAEAQCPVLLGRTGPAETYCPECGFMLAGLGAFNGAGVPEAGGDGPRLEEPGGRSHRLKLGQNVVGRESADVLLPDKTVSRRHARLEVGEDGALTLEDLSSTNGTQVGGDVLVPHMGRALKNGDRVRFGSVITELRLPPGPADEAAPPAEHAAPDYQAPDYQAPDFQAPPAPAPAGPARAQVVETREEGGRTCLLVPGVTTFGRRAESSFIIQGDPYVSGSHAQIIADGDVFRLTDVGSTNGTLLNGQRLAINEAQTLTPGDIILIGGTALRFETLDVPPEAEPEAEPEPVSVPEEAPAAPHAQIYGASDDAPETAPEDHEPATRTES